MTAPDQQDEKFRTILAPTVAAIRELLDEIRATRDRHGGIPWPNSPAMHELDVQSRDYSSIDGWDEPIADAHTFGDTTLIAATDYVETFTRLFETGSAPAYGHLVVARSALEACVVSAWLNDPDVSVRERVLRALCEHLYSDMELKRFKIEDEAAERIRKWKKIARDLGAPPDADRMKPAVGTTTRPSVPDGIDELVTVSGPSRVGRAQWGYLSSVSHVTWHGLRVSIEAEPESSVLEPSRRAHTIVRTQAVQLQAVCLIRVLSGAATTRFRLMGWGDGQWDAAVRKADEHVVWLFSAVDGALAAEAIDAAKMRSGIPPEGH